MIRRLLLAAPIALTLLSTAAPADEAPAFTRTEDVIYGRKFGTALTMDVFKPKEKPNGAAVIFVVSGGWYSSHDNINLAFLAEPLKRGYTVFAVVHGSQPKFTIPEVVADMNRAVRYIRYHAADYGIDGDRIGVMGASAGGHLSLMLGTAGGDGDPKAKDPIDQASSKVQAVACFFPPTDFFNYGKPGEDALGRGVLASFRAPFDFRELDPKINAFVSIVDEAKLKEIGKQISPAYQVTPDDAPSLIIHGDADKLVPIQQAELIVAKFDEAKVPAKLVVKPGAAHGWAGIDKDVSTLVDWFDEHLKASEPAK
ncbi:alpha/beta hydrolase [Isosphaeraceae bacterium EP7]